MKIGRRPVYLLGTFLNLVGCLLGGIQTTVELYYAVNALTGFGAAPVDSLVQISTIDIFFAHERGTRLSLLAFALGAGSYLGPVAAGYITESQTWRWAFWYLSIFFGILLVVQIFTLEESVFTRPTLSTSSRRESLIQLNGILVKEEAEASLSDKGPFTTTGEHSLSGVELPIEASTLSRGRLTYWQRMALIHTKHASPKSWWRLALFPFRLVLFPAIIWSAVMGGVQICWLSLLSVTQSELFSAPPYNFDVASGKFCVSSTFDSSTHTVPKQAFSSRLPRLRSV
jgi:MFS family permease